MMVFQDKKQKNLKAARKNGAFHESAVTILTPGCHFSGKLFCKGSSRIGGKIEGEIISEGLLIIEEGALITANITADEAVIQGKVNGQVQASQKVELAPTCVYTGDIVSPKLIIQEGAVFNGSSIMKLSQPEKVDQVQVPIIEKVKKGNQKNVEKQVVKEPRIGMSH